MDVFGLRERLVEDYEEYTRSFIAVRDTRVSETVDAELEGGLLWPEPLVQLNPSFAKAGRSAVISSNVVEIKGQMWVPVNDFAKAIGAKPQSDSRQFEEIKVTYLKVPSDCGSCPLVTAKR